MFLKKPMDKEILRNLEEMSNLAISMFETAIESLFRLDFNLVESVIQKTKDVNFTMKEALLSSRKIGTGNRQTEVGYRKPEKNSGVC